MSQTRVVLRMVEPAQSGVEATCEACHERIVFSARKRAVKVVANVYENGIWDRVEQYHDEHYDGRYGEPLV